MHEMYQLVFPPKAFVVNPREDQLVAKLRLGNVSIEDVRKALMRISSDHNLSVNHDNDNRSRGYVVRITTDAPSMTEDAIHTLLQELNAHLKRIKRDKDEKKIEQQAVTAPQINDTPSDDKLVLSSKSPKVPYRNRKHS